MHSTFDRVDHRHRGRARLTQNQTDCMKINVSAEIEFYDLLNLDIFKMKSCELIFFLVCFAVPILNGMRSASARASLSVCAQFRFVL